MARIRTIKPEFAHSESMGRVSRDARLLFVQLWTICDDAGRARGNSRMLASLLFPYDDDAPKRLDGWMAELEREGCLVRYKHDGDSYVEVRNWLKHQKIDKPSASRLPAFAKPRDSSPTILERSSEDLVPSTWTKDLDQEGSGGEGAREVRAAPNPCPIPPEPMVLKNPKAQRWPADAVVPDDWIEAGAAARERNRMPPIDLRLEAERFANHFAGKPTTRSDWRRGWLNWCTSDYAGKTNGNGKSAHPFGVFGALLEKEIARGSPPADRQEADDGGGVEIIDPPERNFRAATR